MTDAADSFASLPPHAPGNPRCPRQLFLLGCADLDAARPALGVRRLMVAHHLDPDLEAAALLVFTGLNWQARAQDPLLPVLLDTWQEFRQPAFDRYPRERRLLDDASAGLRIPASASPLARRLLRLPMPRLAAQVQAAIASRNGLPAYDLLRRLQP